MSDLISRQSAIDAIRGADGVVHYWSKQNAIKVLEELPSAQPEIGHWISGRDEDGWHTWLICSKCGAKETNLKAKYCPMCGRKMT